MDAGAETGGAAYDAVAEAYHRALPGLEAEHPRDLAMLETFADAAAEAGGSVVRQTAIFEPRGLAVLLYWYALFPIHRVIFAGMLRGIARAAATNAGTSVPAPVA